MDLVLVEVGHVIDQEPWEGSAKVDQLVHDKGHYASREDIVAHVGVPGSPEFLKVIKRHIVLRDLFELGPVSGGRVWQSVVEDGRRVDVAVSM